jgi:8-oxo-dGTP pyrophosphatase MutT (NUDIX family)
MHRKLLLELLEEYAPNENHQANTKTLFLQFVATCPDCFKRSLEIGHVTGSALICDPDRGQLVLIHHKKLGIWLQPGGHADGEANVYKVAIREAIEETGLKELNPASGMIFDLDIHQIPECGGIAEHFHYDVRFLFEADPRLPLTGNSESHDIRWINFDEIERFTREESMLRMIRKLTAKTPRD